MAKSKSGPPYTGRTAEYVVVTTPWGMNRVPRNRVSQDFNRLAAWVQHILEDKDVHAKVQFIFGMGTRDEVILQLPYGTDIQPLLGEHKLAIISERWEGNPNDDRASCFFEYNFRNNGDPSNHNWAEECPDVTPELIPPVKSPYPEPGWAEPPRSIRSLVLPIPLRPLLPIPEAASEPIPIPVPVPQEATHLPPVPPPAAPSNITPTFKPYEPPTQHPAHGTFINQINQPRNTSANRQSHQFFPAEGERIPALKYVKKLDPYQEDEEAHSLLQTPPRDSQSGSQPTKDEHVKRESSDIGFERKYKPSSELTDSIASLIHEQNEEQKVPVCGGSSITNGPLPGPSTSYQPSAELMDAIDSLIQEQNLDKKPCTENSPQRLQDSRQKPQYQPSAELTNVINNSLQQSTASEDEQKPVPNPPCAHSPLILNHVVKPKSSAKQEEKYRWKTFRYVL
ncbi:hypothetical protein DEU56DRAFT_470765 [Suillus clintonianus]|uniref:uncharacterized protein n=1 Tax=Suillus clintonianus TaxID=1904413 RepID=UPI001B86D2CC|nr:uncharacterized protein DEU56DRAFT_470765 [Suillus clintonianus]KAG2153164.1 hypothetical protein DEU56DRAFT_470765 [Suillus clintonianus]